MEKLAHLPRELGLVETAEMVRLREAWIIAIRQTYLSKDSYRAEPEDQFREMVGTQIDNDPDNPLLEIGWQSLRAYLKWRALEDLYHPDSQKNPDHNEIYHLRKTTVAKILDSLDEIVEQTENLQGSKSTQEIHSVKLEKAIETIENAINYLVGLSFLLPEPNQDSK